MKLRMNGRRKGNILLLASPVLPLIADHFVTPFVNE
jgi:hypothetical protein